MKRYFLLTLPIVALAFSPKNACAQLRYGLKAGVQVAGMHIHQVFQPTSTAPLLTFLASGVAEYEASKNVTLAAGLQVSGAGGTFIYEDPIDNVKDETRYSLLCAQIPLTVRAQHRGFSIGAGLYGGLALFGRKKNTVTYGKSSQTSRSDLRMGNDETSDYARPDWGGLAEAGYSFRNFRVAGHYWLGLANILPKYYRTDGDKRQTRAYGASLTYYLGAGE